MIGAAIDDDTQVAEVAEAAAHDAVAGAAADFDAAAARRFEGKALDDDVARIGHFDQRFLEHGQQRFGRGDGRGRPEIKQPALAIEEPFAGLVEFLQDVEPAETLTGPEAIKTMRRGRLDDAFVQIERGHPFVGVRPIPRPKSMHP